MVSAAQLESMAGVGVKEIDPGVLHDLTDVKIEGSAPARRLESYLAQVGNPYCFRVGSTPVRITFSGDGEPLERKLKSYLLS